MEEMQRIISISLPSGFFKRKLPATGLGQIVYRHKASSPLICGLFRLQIDSLEEELPGLDCGACGAPTCRAFAEDVVKGACKKADCVFVYRKQMQKVASTLSELEGRLTGRYLRSR